MARPESKARFEVKLVEPLPQQSGWLRLTEADCLEVELYDFSSDAQGWFGNDVAWVWVVESSALPRVYARLAAEARCSDPALLAAIVDKGQHARGIVDWLRAAGVPVSEQFDSWA